MTTGEKIKKRRLELGITQKDVAKMIGRPVRMSVPLKSKSVA